MRPEEIDEKYFYSENDLGLVLRENSGNFKCWAPLAHNVELVLFESAQTLESPQKIIKMQHGQRGVWELFDVDVSCSEYYKFRIFNPNGTNDVADIWCRAASADSIASQITQINDGKTAVPADSSEIYDGTKESYVNPFGKNGTEVKKYSDAVIYEMHIRDWSRAYVPSSTGKFQDITQALKKDTDGFACHLKDLGITHVQILPSFDYAQTNSDPSYNWGYNPYHYNVPEGRYVNNMNNGTDAVLQFRQMIQAFHQNGIAVNMDVVYNHTNGVGTNSLYDMTVPGYFYRMKHGTQNEYSDGSGCGNETATNHLMFKKYVIDSLRHWMLDYHINGFRFDLMGVHESSTMKEIYEALYEIDSNVMVYGEPWTGGDCAVAGGADSAGSSLRGEGFGAFEDSFRDAIKGAEFGGFKTGQVQGTFNDEAICTGLTGGTCTRNATGRPELSIHYVECHDNFTLFDKLSISMNGGFDATQWKSYEDLSLCQQELIKAQSKMAAAFVFLSQGTPFINGGQEFMRTKKGNPDSYSADTKGGITWTNESGEYCIDSVNEINMDFKKQFHDVYNTYRGLIKFRSDFKNSFGCRIDATAKVLAPGVIHYSTGDFDVLFNAGDTKFVLDEKSICGNRVRIDCLDHTAGGYSIDEKPTTTESIEAHDFVIIRKVYSKSM